MSGKVSVNGFDSLVFIRSRNHMRLLGWMQCIILIYQMTGANIVLPIHNHVLILASAYLFLSGYGHFTYLWFRNEAGLVRILQVKYKCTRVYFVRFEIDYFCST